MSKKSFIFYRFFDSCILYYLIYFFIVHFSISAELRVQHDDDIPPGAVSITDDDVYRLVKPTPAELTQDNLEQINQLGFDLTLPTQIMDFNAKKDEIKENTEFKLPTRVIIPVLKKAPDEPQLDPPVQDKILPASMIPGKQGPAIFHIDGEKPETLDEPSVNSTEQKKNEPEKKKKGKKKKKKKKRKKKR